MNLDFLKGPGRAICSQFLIATIAAGMFTGCAFSRTPVKVSVNPNVVATVKTPAKASVEATEAKDARLVGDPMVLLHKSNGYGATSGAYVTEQPVAQILRDGVQQALAKNGFTDANATRYELRVELQSFGIGVIQNFFSAATAKPFLTVRFELLDKATKQSVWHDTFSGQATDKLSGWTGEDGNYITKAFSEVSQEVIRQLITDRNFRSYFE